MELLFVAIILTSVIAIGLVHLLRQWKKFFNHPKQSVFGGVLLVLLSLLGLIFGLPEITPIQAQGGLTVEILAGYNLVVDSNVTSPSTYGPSAATVAGRVCNNTGSDIDNVVLNIGDYGSGTPGL